MGCGGFATAKRGLRRQLVAEILDPRELSQSLPVFKKDPDVSIRAFCFFLGGEELVAFVV
jgi:hypothetical protein